MLSSLHPPLSSSCRIDNHFIFYDNKYFNISSIHYNQIDHWNTSNRPLVLYFHGGGFFFGDLDTYSGFECHLAQDFNMTILHVNFGLVPEYPLKKIMEDVIDVYKILHYIDPYINKRMIGMGDSSGGMLWIYLLQWIVSNNRPLPQGVVLHSPWLSLDLHNININIDWITYMSIDSLSTARFLVFGNDTKWFYWTDEEKEKISPKSDSFERFPPLYITAGSHELFTYEARSLVGKLRLAGVEVVYEEGEGLMHTYALFHLWSPKARSAQKNVRQWIQKRLSKNPTLRRDVKTFVNESVIF
jgi:acetyl esterase/lipase